MDNLKKYLQQNLEELDTDVPGDAVWQRIQKEAVPVLPKRNVIKPVWRYAAAACILACIAATIIYFSSKKPATELVTHTAKDTGKQPEIIVANQRKMLDSDTNKIQFEKITPVRKKVLSNADDYVKNTKPKKTLPIKKQLLIDPSQLIIDDVEQNYAQLINRQLSQLRITPVYAESPDYFSSFKQQLRQLESDEISIKKEIRLHGLTDELLQQLINISQQKLNLLKDLRTEISKLNNKVKQPQNKQDSSQLFYLSM